jgi:hypothetical protein
VRAGQRLAARVDDHATADAVDHQHVAGPNRSAEAGHAQHRGNLQGAQHDGGMAVGPALLGGDTGQPRGVQKRRVGRPQALAGQYRARWKIGKAAERRLQQIADQPPPGFAHLFGTAPPRRRFLARRQCHDRRRSCLGLVGHRGFRVHQLCSDPLADAAGQARRADHLLVGIEQGRDLGLAGLGQHAQLGA